MKIIPKYRKLNSILAYAPRRSHCCCVTEQTRQWQLLVEGWQYQNYKI